ncbi:hypothetical protein AURANDRAFT_71377 [Aureococcus anophagefferens]|uniref:Helicase ATP-binding domain-containing protein n=1 Tax=Aureococcus anophagefferens TaxID=44056 RepID=F0Y606_AURAN|nr:hypothetical protein AURANDRAFT_71377 [Aureococcus anophagefferens]EGB09703.1 hypothetical protein AURANDRAFT_71377 [Aureococcus anophagefferens]|eukprot:XP_009035747.1 hypothetical protein AURANDRAFT_71377 [Aureococcus anophagefferens]
MQDALRAVKEAWGAERWAELDSSTKTKLWTLNMKQEDGWRPPALPGAAPEEPASAAPEEPPSAAPEVPPSAAPEEPPSAAPEVPPSVTPEPAAEDGAAPEPDEEDDGLAGLVASLALEPAAAEPEAATAVPDERAEDAPAVPEEPPTAAPDEAPTPVDEAPTTTEAPKEEPPQSIEAPPPAAPDDDDDDLVSALSSLGLGRDPKPKPAPSPFRREPTGPAWASLRDYQRRLVLDAEAALRSPGNRTEARPFASALLSLATGGGKTRVAAALLERLCGGRRALFVVNRTVLAAQTRRALRDFAAVDERDDGFRKPWGSPDECDARPRVTVATIQALRASGAAEAGGLDFDAVVVDEAHSAAADSYLSLLFTGLASKPRCVVIGLTATPFRLSRDAVLGSAFGGSVAGPQIRDLVASGHLARPDVVGPTPKDRLAVRALRPRTSKSAKEDRALDDADAVRLAVRCWARVAADVENATAVAFCRDVKHSLALRDALRAAGFRAEHVDGSTKEKARGRVLGLLADRNVDVVTNAALLCEGFDEPSLSAVLLLRKTESPALYAQQVGRALRGHPGKDRAVVVDVAGNSRRHATALFGDAARADRDDGGALAKALAENADAAPAAPKKGNRQASAPPPPPPGGLVALGRRGPGLVRGKTVG